jgi:ketosteroid isomerase-like protein
MSGQNLQLVRAAYEAGRREDWDAFFRLCHPDFEWETDARVPNAGVYRGRDEIQRFVDDQAAPFDRTITELEQLLPSGDQVVALVRVRRRPRGTTAEINLAIAHLWTIRDGKAARCQAFAERERALEAARLPA